MQIDKITEITNTICGAYPAAGVETTAQAMKRNAVSALTGFYLGMAENETASPAWAQANSGWAGVFNACLEAGRICRAQGVELGWDVEEAAEKIIKAANAAGFRANGKTTRGPERGREGHKEKPPARAARQAVFSWARAGAACAVMTFCLLAGPAATQGPKRRKTCQGRAGLDRCSGACRPAATTSQEPDSRWTGGGPAGRACLRRSCP